MNSIKVDPFYNNYLPWWYRPEHIRITDERYMNGIYQEREYKDGKEVFSPKVEPPKGYISSKEAVALTSRSFETLNAAAFYKRIDKVKLNNKNYYSLESLLRYSKIARSKLQGGTNE